MSDTLLFIHGTGVRQEGYLQTMANLAKGMAKAKLGHVRIDGVPWGHSHGTQFTSADIDAVLPPTKTRAVYDVGDWEAAIWADLLDDPLLELRLAAIRRPPAAPVADGVVLPGVDAGSAVDLDSCFDRLGQTLANPLPGQVTAESIREAANWVRRQPTLAAAAAVSTNADQSDLIFLIARSLVAFALSKSRGEPGAGPSALYVAADRKMLVEAVESALNPDTRGIKDWLFGKIKDLAEAKATSIGKGRRDGLMNGISPGLGDILLYQRRGDDILAEIEDKIVKLSTDGGNLVVLGHSLGGIMLVDLLSRPRAAGKLRVSRLITAGSQAPMLFKCDALGTMRPNAQLPEGMPFTPWLNIFDRNDFLSFCGKRVFPNASADIEDFEVECGVPFPEAHSAYFHLDSVYRRISEIWPR
jgi:hypothetical protein